MWKYLLTNSRPDDHTTKTRYSCIQTTIQTVSLGDQEQKWHLNQQEYNLRRHRAVSQSKVVLSQPSVPFVVQWLDSGPSAQCPGLHVDYIRWTPKHWQQLSAFRSPFPSYCITFHIPNAFLTRMIAIPIFPVVPADGILCEQIRIVKSYSTIVVGLCVWLAPLWCLWQAVRHTLKILLARPPLWKRIF